MDFSEKTLQEEDIFIGSIIDVKLQTVELPNKKIAKREIVRHPGGVAILAFKDSSTIIMVEQFRKPFDSMMLEIPAGKLEKGENIEECGKRELEEETGYKAKKFEYLGKMVSSPGFCDECIYIFKAQELYIGTIGGDEDEFINVKEINIDKVKQMIKTGEIIDGKSICSLMFI